MVPELSRLALGTVPELGPFGIAHPYKSRILYTRRETSALTT